MNICLSLGMFFISLCVNLQIKIIFTFETHTQHTRRYSSMTSHEHLLRAVTGDVIYECNKQYLTKIINF